MCINRSVFLFIFLSSIISNSESIDEKINEDIMKINEVEKQVKYDKIEDITEGSGNCLVFSDDNSSNMKIVNNSFLKSSNELIKKLSKGSYDLLHITNNKKIIGEDSAKLSQSKYIYFKNSENAVISNEIYNKSIHLKSEELIVLNNAGTIEGKIDIRSKYGSVINKESGIHKNADLEFREEGNYKNEGKVNGNVKLNAYLSFRFVNSGTINGNIETWTRSYSDKFNDKDIYLNNSREALFLNTSTGIINSESSIKLISGTANMNFQNFGNIETEDLIIMAAKGRIDNNKKIKGNLQIHSIGAEVAESPISDEKMQEIRENSVLNVNLQNGVLEGNLLLSRKGFKETIVTIKSMDNVTGELDSTEGDNDTLRLIGEGKITDSNKFKEFEKLHLDSSKWEFINEEYKVNNEILVENSNPSIRKAKLKTKKFTNNERSTINVLEASNIEVEDKFVNKGLISFLNSKDNTSNLSIKGNYIGENSKLLMRTYIDELKSDKLKLDGSVNGSTGVEISNPNSTLDKRMKNKLKLIETKSSTKDAFTLLNSEYGIYKYGLNLEGNDWYLNQTYNMPIIGIILNSTNNARNEFNLTFNDHNESIANKKLWTKLSKIYSNNILSGDNKFNLPIKSNTSNIFMGYDLVESNIKDRTYKYGVFGNVGFDKANNLGKTNAFGLGIYGTFKNNNWYVDSWLNYMYLKNRIAIKNELRYINHALKASLEIGTRGDMYIGKMRLHSSHYWQLIYSHIFNTGLKYDEDVKYFGNSNIKSRLGTNLTLFTHFKNINPYLEFNWIYDTRLVGVRVEKEEYLYNNNKNTFELKWGLREMNVNDRLSMWVNIVHRFNEAGYRANGVEAGMVYKMI
ncbi:autotransporter domain-containing protein [Streptobacillus moniliformis]|uniref:Outer membrane autotransporter barrel domain protein n=1 Tax=Streptobacillus moniliformis (strain ATCC 14647 / DSM 12112 / NCTC 10651 / 9901) TaxID=519441 RepID=D1AYB4_STRM9|nr:autotransporter domain-containing protein [Streptobacillus moniliformis]ACZ01290.1 outer membrane autotransporter barrel domain protein [Streptobacillus moniliformis DSM 12112]AVL42355.1 autotransporter domain-containing protein [Streptobacillus moniliformis]SQA13552.1 Outer membrane protein IcsA autotransporter precursor [Streptobacillus moniliformis]